MSDAAKIFLAGDGDADARLDFFLCRHLQISRSAAQRMIAAGDVRIDGSYAVRKGTLITPGQRIEISAGALANDQTLIPRPDLPLVELNRGDGWIALDKPAGLPVHPLHSGESETLLNAALARHPEIQGIGEGALRSGVVHRLDIDTSGVILFATKQNTWQHLRRAFQEHRAQKIYHAILAGQLKSSARLVLDLQIAQHSPARVKIIDEKIIPKPPGTRRCDLTYCAIRSTPSPGTPGEGGGEGISAFSVQRSAFPECPHPNPLPEYRARGQAATLLEINLGTGFLHQIRVMLAHIGHPILGDILYGPPTSEFPRQMLHAQSIRIGDIHAESPYPPDFADAISRLGLDN